ncbi:type II toxin-antitoxin system VapC family toxin [Spirosoma endbachense]|uniref:PIN domain-containing protein n=1 Tax=Spirosoma endbachense TaxID=2666025 RepID=A0A6P1VLC7_9BACT|nr:type II toxin-antitoxin system VapC family toxin [Spirosoma endbachense]QHV93853.1 PIN domain-containing protein [Spirosoma endbachense]
MADRILMVDTSLLIDYFRKTDKSKTKLVQLSLQFEQLAISSVTEFEVYSGATAAQLVFWNELLSEILVFPFDSKAAHTAVSNQLPLDTLNRKHVDNIPSLTLLNT